MTADLTGIAVPELAVPPGWNAPDVARIARVAAAQATDALLILQGGQPVLTLGDPARKFLCHSIRKSFLAAMIGEDVAAGRIDLAATMGDLGIDDHNGLSEVERAATVFDLMCARSGVYHPAGYETAWMQMIKERRHTHPPGTFWLYNNWDFNVLGTIFQAATGCTVAEAFRDRLAVPLEMQDFSLDGPDPDGWSESFAVSRHDAYPFRLSSRDLARFGQLFLQKGRWDGRQLIAADWVRDCVMPYSHAGAQGAYGFMWWLGRDGVMYPGVRVPPGSYAAHGAGGHYCLVMPTLDMVVVHRVDTGIPGREVTKFGFGRLLAAILAACGGAG